MAELRHLVAYLHRPSGQCDWELWRKDDASGLDVRQLEHNGRLFISAAASRSIGYIRDAVRAQAYERTREAGKAMPIPPDDATAVVGVPHG